MFPRIPTELRDSNSGDQMANRIGRPGGIRLASVVVGLVALSAVKQSQLMVLEYAPHDEVNPFTGVVAWSTDKMPQSISMEWAFVGLSDVLPSCKAPNRMNWRSVDDMLANHAANGHHTILRPVTFGPGCEFNRAMHPTSLKTFSARGQ